MGFKLTDPTAHPLPTRDVIGEGTRRYHQDAAVRALAQTEDARAPVAAVEPAANRRN